MSEKRAAICPHCAEPCPERVKDCSYRPGDFRPYCSADCADGSRPQLEDVTMPPDSSDALLTGAALPQLVQQQNPHRDAQNTSESVPQERTIETQHTIES